MNDEYKIVLEESDIIPGKLYRYQGDLLWIGRMFFRLIWGNPLFHYLVGVEVLDNGLSRRYFVDLNIGRDPYAVSIVSLHELNHRIIYEIDDREGIAGHPCRTREETVVMALNATQIPHQHRILYVNCANFAFYCKLADMNSIADIPCTFGQRRDIRLTLK